MAYSDFTLARVKAEFGVTVVEGVDLFTDVIPIEASAYLKEGLKRCERFVTLVNTEKVRSEFLIAPVLGEVLEQSNQTASLVISHSNSGAVLTPGLKALVCKDGRAKESHARAGGVHPREG